MGRENELVRFGLNKVIAFTFCALIIIPEVKSQTNGCSVEGIEIQKCFGQGDVSNFSIDSSCCKILNQAVRTGFSCLCLLVTSSIPLLSTPIALPLANCYISAPPLSLCHELAPMPVELPPHRPKELNPLPPAVKAAVIPPPPPQEIQVPLSSAGIRNSTMPETVNQRPQDQMSPPKINLIQRNYATSTGNVKTMISLRQSLFVSLILLLSFSLIVLF
ncbi:hypothetical protein ACFE04_015086 [Oxalis oulophora]